MSSNKMAATRLHVGTYDAHDIQLIARLPETLHAPSDMQLVVLMTMMRKNDISRKITLC